MSLPVSKLKAGIFVHGVPLAWPHERAWRDALEGFAEPARFTTAVYQAEVAGRARLDGAVSADPDAPRLVQALVGRGLPMAVASSSKNADQMMAPICLASGERLLGAFSAHIRGRDLAAGEPAPDIFLFAARALGVAPHACFVAEDATAGIEAAGVADMTALGVARRGDADPLHRADANLVVATLDDIDINALTEGRLCRSVT